jgi:hypothetical protein
MAKMFSIKSKYFSLYQAFREEAEKVGWVHNVDFNPFTEEQCDYSNCVFFHTEWKFEGHNPMFSFSNSDENVFELPRQWDEALEFMKQAFKPENQKPKLTISLKDLADHHGVNVEDIIITA